MTAVELAIVVLSVTTLLATAVLAWILLRRARGASSTPGKIGRRFGEYRIVRALGLGGEAEIYEARVPGGAPVALKILHASRIKDAEATQRFFEEGRVLRTLAQSREDLPIVKCLGEGVDRQTQRPYLVLELLHAVPLDKWLANGKPLSEGDIRVILRDVCRALAGLHALGYCHQDISAHNVMVLGQPGHATGARLIDFGTARRDAASEQVRSGIVHGKPNYLSPEECRGERATRESDLYSLGVLLYQMLCGHLPYQSATSNPAEVLQLHQTGTPPTLPSEVPALLRCLTLSLMDKVPARRVSAHQMIASLNSPSSNPVAALPGHEGVLR